MSAGFRVARSGSGRVGRALRGVFADAGGDRLDPVSRGRWELACRLGDSVDGAIAGGNDAAVSRLSLSLLRALDALGRPVVKDPGEVTPDSDGDESRPPSIDEQYARLCSQLGNPAES